MLRNVLSANINNLNDTEKYILGYVTKWDVNKLIPTNCLTDDEIRKVLYNGFSNFFSHPVGEMAHPYLKVWHKIVDGAYMDKLISETELYGKRYDQLAKVVNEAFGTLSRSNVYTILKAFVERDWDELSQKIWLDCDDENLSPRLIQENIEEYGCVVAENLDEEDLKAILLFCGYDLNKLT